MPYIIHIYLHITNQLHVILPSQVVKVNGEFVSVNGKTFLDSKTQISYSNNAEKTLTFTSNLKDMSDYHSTNYSMAMGVSHPYNNINMQMTSHVGSSDEKMTVGVETSYLTFHRQTKNLALLAEINKIRKQISMQVLSFFLKNKYLGSYRLLALACYLQQLCV